MDLVSALRSHPLLGAAYGEPIEVLDWRANERGTPRFAGVMNHHTVSGRSSGRYPSKPICRNGRGGTHPVPGPLCNILGARGGGSIAVISNRVANHAGTGDPDVIARLRRSQPPKPRPGPDRKGAEGGPSTVGIEWENDGTGEPWSPRMVDTMVRVNAALCDIHGWDPTVAVIGHLEFTARKIDPAFHDPRMTMGDFRRLVADCLAAYRGAPPKEDAMTPAQEAKLDTALARLAALEKQVDDFAVNGYKGHVAALRQLDAITAEVAPKGPGARSIRTLLEMIWNALYTGEGKLKPVIARFLG